MSNNETKLQVKCLIGDEGHVWISSYDRLPAAVRERLRNSPFNLCAACLVMFVLPKVVAGNPLFAREREKALFAAIEMMEAEVRKETLCDPLILSPPRNARQKGKMK